jgi:hypothetical protein
MYDVVLAELSLKLNLELISKSVFTRETLCGIPLLPRLSSVNFQLALACWLVDV